MYFVNLSADQKFFILLQILENHIFERLDEYIIKSIHI